MNSVGVEDNTCAGRDTVAHVLVVFGDGVRSGAEERGGHPAEGFFDTASNVLHLRVRLVCHGGGTVTDGSVNGQLCFLLDVRKDDHSLGETIECVGGRVGAGSHDSTCDISSEVVVETSCFLFTEDISDHTWTRIASSLFDSIFCIMPVGEE